MDEVSIQLGVPDDQVKAAAELYGAALGEKLTPFLGQLDRAAPFLASGLVKDRAFVALQGGRLVGIAGFELDGQGLFKITFKQMIEAYGWSALLRYLGLALLERKEEPDCLLMDGIAVADDARGRGIGSRLLNALTEHASALGKASIRLDVIDTNPNARRLYERMGFNAEKTEDIGPLRWIFPFQKVTEMRKPIDPKGTAH